MSTYLNSRHDKYQLFHLSRFLRFFDSAQLNNQQIDKNNQIMTTCYAIFKLQVCILRGISFLLFFVRLGNDFRPGHGVIIKTGFSPTQSVQHR